ncbi:MinD/ParA family ATP-binding protein [Halocatena marina]|uniref:MinD/ParA family ATP-binding protein n=1 Tax=Halocatena marina TaxID=2934937 RepID=UPI00200E3B52|nr:MinD/ParA family protein [Halocatena marina]
MTATVYAIAGGKGGVGKSTAAVNLGATLRATGRSVALVDADLVMPNLQGIIGLSHEPTIHEVLSGTVSLAEACVERVIGTDEVGQLDVYPGSGTLDAYGQADPDRLADVVETLAEDYDSLILNTGTGLTHEVAVPLQLADSTIIVTTPAEVAVVDAIKTIRLIDHLDGTVGGMVVSRTCKGLSAAEIPERMGVAQLTTIPSFTGTVRDLLAAYRRLAVRLIAGPNVPPEAVTAQEGPAAMLTPAVVPPTEVDPNVSSEEGDKEQNGDADVPNNTTDSDTASETDESDGPDSDDVPGWFTGMVD